MTEITHAWLSAVTFHSCDSFIQLIFITLSSQLFVFRNETESYCNSAQPTVRSRRSLCPSATVFNIVFLYGLGAGIAQLYSAGLRAGRSGVRIPAGAWNFSFHHRVQTGSEALSASYPMRTSGSFPEGKAAEAWSWPLTHLHLVPRSRMRVAIPPLHQYAFMAWCSVKAQEQLYLSCTDRGYFHVCNMVTENIKCVYIIKMW
jgi:hypothetical protein